MPWIDRNDEGRIIGRYACQQYEEQEWMDAVPEFDESAASAPALLTAYEFKERFSPEEQALILTSPEFAPLALHVLTAPRGVDVTDETAQQARAALAAATDDEGNQLFSDARLDAIFSVPE